jgi:hypothetical protein
MAPINLLPLEKRYVVDEDTGCWNWAGGKTAFGYGVFRRNYKMGLAHRFMYEIHVGPIPDGLHIDHLCRNPPCVNPAHLEPVTQKENNRREWEARTRPETCLRGHPLDGVRKGYSSRRYCTQCVTIRKRLSRQSKRAS